MKKFPVMPLIAIFLVIIGATLFQQVKAQNKSQALSGNGAPKAAHAPS